MKEKKRTHSGLIIFIFFAITLGIPIWMFCYVFSPKTGDPGAIKMNEYYHQKMEVLLEADNLEISGSKAVCYFSYDYNSVGGNQENPKPFFTKDYIPKSLVAMKPENVRYIVYCNSIRTESGTHRLGLKHVETYNKYISHFKIYDRSNGEIIDTRSVETDSSWTEVDEIQRWILASIGKNNS